MAPEYSPFSHSIQLWFGYFVFFFFYILAFYYLPFFFFFLLLLFFFLLLLIVFFSCCSSSLRVPDKKGEKLLSKGAVTRCIIRRVRQSCTLNRSHTSMYKPGLHWGPRHFHRRYVGLTLVVRDSKTASTQTALIIPCFVGLSVQFSSVLWPTEPSEGHDGQFSTDPLLV